MSSMLELPPGLYTNVPPEVYHERVTGLVSKSALDLVDRSLGHYKAWLDGAERPLTDSLVFGSALHVALLEPERFLREYVVAPDFGDCRFKENKARRDAWRAANAGRQLLDAADAQAITGIVTNVLAHPTAGAMIRNGMAEATLRWRDEETGLECKARADYYVAHLNACWDVKTTVDARPDAFARSMAFYRYHVQDAFYRQGFAAIGRPLEHFVFIAVEKTPPYALALYTLRDADVALGDAAARRNMRTLLQGIEEDRYPAYPTDIQPLGLPGWYTAQQEEIDE